MIFPATSRPPLSARLLAGARLAGMGLLWLAAWAPLAIYCLVFAALGALRPDAASPSPGEAQNGRTNW